jgi:hypothetical protein
MCFFHLTTNSGGCGDFLGKASLWLCSYDLSLFSSFDQAETSCFLGKWEFGPSDNGALGCGSLPLTHCFVVGFGLRVGTWRLVHGGYFMWMLPTAVRATPNPVL